MSEFFSRYYPTICIRRAEMKAMENLPATEKAKMLPIVLLAPWLNSIKFDNTFERIGLAVGETPIIVDLDRDYQSSSPLESRRYFRGLLTGAKAAEEWVKLIAEHENYIPIVQNYHNDDQIEFQIDQFKAMNRGYGFRIQANKSGEIDFALKWVDRTNLENQIVILDGGWQDYSSEQELVFTQKINKLIKEVPEVRFVVTSSNFPNSFTEFDDISPVTIDSRILYTRLFSRFGNYQMYYGDWASTKPRRYDGGGAKPLDRIDFPTKDRWIIARSKEQEWDFVEAAKRVVRLPEWRNRPQIWGTALIEKTALNLPGSITTGPQAIAARVNIHLFLQNNYGTTDLSSVPTVSAWVDPI